MERLYVTFSLKTPGSRWREGMLPDGWQWEGSSDVMREVNPIEDRYSGPLETLTPMRKYLSRLFARLRARGTVTKYKITRTRTIPDDGKGGWPRGLPP